LPALEYVGYMLTRSEFVAWLRERRSAGHSFTAIARDLGVSRQAVQQWLSGATQPSRTALMLAEPLYLAPLEMRAGLPLPAERDRPT
jgi:transcriptional regulator with XRE-family HTH domain